MSITAQINPFAFFADSSGLPLDDGYIWVGVPNLNPITSPGTLYFDAALTIPAPNPLRTSNGYIYRNGAPTFLYANANYSILVQNKNGTQVYYVPDFQMIGNGSAVSLGDIQNLTDPTKGISLIPTAARLVPDIATLKTMPKTGGSSAVFVQGYYAKGDGGGGNYYYDSADTVSADNGGSIIVAADGGRWKLDQVTPWSVKQFGAKGDGTTDDTAAIQAAFNASPASGGRLDFPLGVYNYTKLTFDSATGLTLVGTGAINATTLRCTSLVSTDGIKLRSSFDCTAQFITFDHSSASFTGYLIELNHKPSSSTDTQGMYFFRCTFASQGFNKYTAKGVNLDQATLVTFEGCKFGSLLRPVDGQNPAGGSYSNGIRFKDCQSFDNVGFFANYLGQHWTFQDCNFQACHDGAQRIAFSDNTTSWQNLVFINCGVYDATAIGPAYLNLGTGQGLNVSGGLWGGRGDLGSATLFSATGVVGGVSFKTTRASLFTNFAVAGVAGNTGWDFSGGNVFVNVTNLIISPLNVDGLSFDLNAPNVSRGTLPSSNGSNSLRYNQDGSIEMSGTIASVGAGGSVPISFPLANFPTACWTVQLTLQSPAATGNVVSLVGAPTATGFTVFIAGSGNSAVCWRALGK